MKGAATMNDIRKKLDKLEEMKEQIRQEKEKMNTYIGRQLLSKLNIQHEDLSKVQLEEFINTLATLYQNHNTTEKAPHYQNDN